MPLRIIEGETVRRLAEERVIVIAAGGGGIPVCERRGRLQGVDAVIDKDLASAVLARDVGAMALFILTDVPKVYLDFGSARQRGLARMTAREARDHLRAGQFPPGSMGPKVEAAAQFAEECGGRAVITSPGALKRALAGKDGTWVERR
jgi:carbamate kinase